MKRLLYFFIGAGVGSVTSYFITKNHFEKIRIAEVEQLRGYYDKKVEEEHVTREELNTALKDLGYSPIDEDEDEEDDFVDDEDVNVDVHILKMDGLDISPEVIEPDEFGSEDGYDTRTLIYYADGVLTDELTNEIVSRDYLSTDFDKRFGEYVTDVVFVRNYKHKMDYEILYDRECYYEIYEDEVMED